MKGVVFAGSSGIWSSVTKDVSKQMLPASDTPLFYFVYADFSATPLAINRIIPLVVQESGYYSGWSSSVTCASLYMNNLAVKLREYNKMLFQKYGFWQWSDMVQSLYSSLQANNRSHTNKTAKCNESGPLHNTQEKTIKHSA